MYLSTMLNTEGTMFPPRKEHPLTHSDSAVKPALSSTTSGFLQATFIVLSRLVDHRGNVYGNEL